VRKNDAFVIVSGLPRCGTSMMMQMLEAGGMPIVTDRIRKADEDNPRGYYEFEKVKQIKEDSSWLAECHGKVFKMVSALLYHLPENKKYKVIFMKRNMAEMLASQKAMLKRQGQNGGDVSDEEMGQKFNQHLIKMQDWLKAQQHIDVLYISFNETIQNPTENAGLVNQFLGNRLNEEKMANVVSASLHRQKKEEVSTGI
jgi:hypothetical protein